MLEAVADPQWLRKRFESEAALDVVERGLDKRALAEAIPLAERTLILVEAAELTSPSLGRCRIGGGGDCDAGERVSSEWRCVVHTCKAWLCSREKKKKK